MFNGFSGVPIYEKMIYIGYNILFTAYPVVWFAIMDLEISKKELISNPYNYELGLLNLCFSKFIFLWWFFYGVWQGALLFFMCFLPYETQGGSFWLEGNFVYTGVVIIANIKILNSTSNHTFFSFFFFFATLILFTGALAFLDFLKENDIYGTLTVQLISWEFYLGITFMSLAVVFVDIGLNYFTTRYRKHMIKIATTVKSVVTLSILRDR